MTKQLSTMSCVIISALSILFGYAFISNAISGYIKLAEEAKASSFVYSIETESELSFDCNLNYYSVNPKSL